LQCGSVVQGSGKRARIQRVVYGESLTVARGSAEMTPAAEMPAAVKMRAAMTTAVMTPTVTTAVMASAVSSAVSSAMSTAMASTVTTATFRRGMFCGRQRGRQDNDGDGNIEL
jgi:hypothetical protein